MCDYVTLRWLFDTAEQADNHKHTLIAACQDDTVLDAINKLLILGHEPIVIRSTLSYDQ